MQNLCNIASIAGVQCEPFADMARLGEVCENATCYEGTCFRKLGEKIKRCRRLVNPGMKGCNAPFASCLQGNVCVNNTCQKGYERPVDVKVVERKKVVKVPWWKERRWRHEDMFYNLAPMLIVVFLVFLIGIMYGMLFMKD